ncbi:VOC family protein [Streptomyces fagopyri]|uniref:VOC family protein n=1 Tax=Streptomyces fagopyri TaxID=2662397 RepID=UPI0033FAB823
MRMHLELFVLPVSDVDRARGFYEEAGFRLDLAKDVSEEYRVVHLTPPGSESSIIFGKGITTATPGSVQGLYLVVDDIEEARAELVGRGVAVSEVFHDARGIFFHGHDGGDVAHDGAGQDRMAGPHPERASHGSYATFSDPDGNGRFVQEITRRFPGR